MGFAIAFIVFSSQGNEISTLSIDGSLRSKELVDPNAPMSSEEAIKKLKAYKEKLDLGLISQEEYDSYKLELSKFIE
jgi:predicted ATP-grasp superfamily ATP-dependent carboligase